MDAEEDAMSLGGGIPGGGKPGGGGGRVARALRRRLPVLVWAPRYTRTAALADAVAGLTLGLTLVPQSIAYAALADLPVHYGLYSSFVGTMLYVFLGTVKEVSIGPTSLMALLTLQTCHGLPIEFVVLLTFLSGCVVLAMGLLKLGFLVELISPAVTSGFTSATAVIIAVAQVKGLLGVSFLAESLVDNVMLLAANIQHVRLADTVLGLTSCAVLLALRKVKDIPVDPKRVGLRRGLWLLSISRNALVVCAGATLAYCTAIDGQDKHPHFKLSGRVEPGLPPLGLPPLSVRIDNTTVLGFMDMARRISSGILMLPIVMVLANIAIAKSFSGGARVDATQEMITLGVCNMFGALVHAMPTCGAFTRSAVSHASGVRTPLAGMYSGIITLLALAFLTQYFFYIPKASLSAVLICAVIFMVDTSTVRMLWGTSKAELCILSLTFAVSVCAGVELALLCGVLAALARLLHRVMRPKLHVRVLKSSAGVCCVLRPTLCCVYMNAEYVCARVTCAVGAARARYALLDCTDLSLIDHAAIQVFERLIKKMNAVDEKLIFFNSSEEVLNKLGSIKGADVRTLTARTAADALRAADVCGDVTQPLLHHAPEV